MATATEDVVLTEAVKIEDEADILTKDEDDDVAELDSTKTAEYSYTDRGEFTSEIFKIEVRGLPVFGIGEFKKLLRKNFDLEACKIKSQKRREFAYVCFRSKADQQKAVESLNGFVWKRRALKASVSNPTPDPLVKRRLEDQGKESESKRRKNSAEATCPLFSIPYETQLKQKRDDMERVLEEFGKKLYKINPDAKGLLLRPEGNLPCKFLGIRPSPKIQNYRNKSEFAIGKNENGEIIVGFRLGSYVEGSVEVGSIDDLPHIPDKMKKAAKVFEKYASQSKFTVFQNENNSGHFKQLSVRTSEASDEVMIIVGVYSSNCTAEELVELKTELKVFFDAYNKIEFECTSLYYQDLQRRKPGQLSNPVEHLSGKTHIYDMIHGLKFRISPLAFFQVNTPAAEVLYRETMELARPKPHTTVLDICCGTGTIGLCFSRKCKQVIGVEIIADAVKDAEFNSEENGIVNCKFHAGNANEYIQSMVREVVYGTPNKDELDLVAIVDPPRDGLHDRSIHALRSAKGLNRLVYLSCNPKRAERNWLALGRPDSKTYKGEPFLPTLAVAVDMFPHTAHNELIVLFERVVEEKPKPKEKEKIDDEIKEELNVDDQNVSEDEIENDQKEEDETESVEMKDEPICADDEEITA